MLRRFKYTFIALLLLAGVHSFGQGEIKDSTLLITQISAFGSHYLTAGDFSDKYLSPTIIGASVHIKNRKNWIFGVDGGYVFRDGIKDAQQYLSNMRTSTGQIIAQNGDFAPILSNLRGFVINAHIGKVFSVIGPNPNSGILVRAGVGFLQHKINFEARTQDVPQVEDEMRKYYDQLTNGISFNQFIGYQHLSNSRLTNFYVGIEGFQALTRNRRDFNIDLGGPDDHQNLDMLFGLKVGWIVLIYKRKPDEFYFY